MSKKRIKWDIEKVKQYFEDHDCELLETEYKNCDTPMKYRCDCGNEECKISFYKFKIGQRCMECSRKKRRLKFKFVKQYFEDHDCELLETEYKSCDTPMKYRCDCGNDECKICFSEFKRGQRCMECSRKKRRLAFDFVKQYFEDNDCELLETEYIDSHTLMKYRCDCGNSDCKICFANFKTGSRCAKCAGNEKFTFEEVKQYFEDHDCELLETEYINSSTLMKYRCDCGNSDCKIRFNSFRQGARCAKCAGNEKHTFEYVKQYFEDHDCELLETEYINSRTKMRYICDCGNDECKIIFNNFKQGHRCRKCYIERNSGKNSYNYNPDLTDEEREKSRYCSGLGKWRKDVCERDNNACQCCGEVEGILCAHHIEAYKPNKELRIVVSNGILLCKEHHIEFHKRYGNDCNREQLEEFLLSFAEIINIDERNR